MSDSHTSAPQTSAQSPDQSHSALVALRKMTVAAPPFLANRVVNQALRKTDSPQTGLRINLWFWPALSGVLACALVWILSSGGPMSSPSVVKTYALNQPYLIRLDLRALDTNDIAYAEIHLDNENIHFASTQFAEVQSLKTLSIAWEQLLDKQYLPIVVQGSRSGHSLVRVEFYDHNRKLMTTKQMTLIFGEGAT